MNLKAKINQDLKNALTSGNHLMCDTLRLLKAEIANREIALGVRETGLTDEQIEEIIAKEVKKRREAATLYTQVGRNELASKETSEVEVLVNYLPKMLSREEVSQIVDELIASGIEAMPANMGRLISAVKTKVGNSAEGSLVAELVKERIQQ